MSDLKDIKPHPNGWEYVIEDVPAEPTPKNRPSAILFNWMIKTINNLETLLTTSKEVTLKSDDRVGWLKEDGGFYNVGENGVALGYPSAYMVIVNVKRNSTLTIQMAFTSNGQSFTRTVNQSSSSLDWTMVGTPLITPSSWVNIPLQPGVTTSYAPQCRRSGNTVEINGLVTYNFTSSTAYIHVATIPQEFRPTRTIRFSALNLTSPVVVEILPDGKVNIGNRGGVATNSWTSIGCTYVID